MKKPTKKLVLKKSIVKVLTENLNQVGGAAGAAGPRTNQICSLVSNCTASWPCCPNV